MQNPLETLIDLNQIPGMSVATTSPAGEIMIQAAGITSKATPQAVTETTVFEAASLSKPVFAYVILKLAERKTIDLDRPLHEYVPEFGLPEMRSAAQYKQLTARMILSHQAGLPNEFDPEHGVPFAYVSPVGQHFDYSGEAFRLLQEVVEKVIQKTLEELAQEEFAKIGMTHSSFSPPTGCSLIRLADNEPPPTPERLKPLLTNQVSIICAGDKLYVAEKLDDVLRITEKSPGQSEAEIAQIEAMKTSIKSLPGTPFSRPAEARDLELVTAIIGHRPKDCVKSLAIGHLDKGIVNTNQRFYGVHPAGSLYTTATDYGKFLRQCTTDEFIRREMFRTVVPSLAGKDTKAIAAGVSPDILGQISWGVGIGLQQTPDGRSIAFQWGGDNRTGCNFAAIDLKTNRSVACFTNSNNGPSVFRQVVEPVVGNIQAISEWLSPREKLDFKPTALLAAREINNRFRSGMQIKPPSETGKIILLCGTSTAGKTNTCTAMQAEARKTGHNWIIDGGDIAAEKAWTEPSEIAGKRYDSAQDHLANAMKTYADPSVVDAALKAFGARTLVVSLFSRRNLGHPKVDQVDLTPEADIKSQATKIYGALSPENKAQYTPVDIENLLQVIRDCPTVEEFMTKHPYPPLEDINKHMLERAIIRAKKGESTIFDIIGNEVIDGQRMVDQFHERLKAAGLPTDTGTVALIHCPVATLIDRMDGRNSKAIAEGRKDDVRQSFFPFDQYGLLYEKAPDLPDPTRPIVGVVTRNDITLAAHRFGKEEDATSLLAKLGFTDGEESISVISKVKVDTLIQTGTQSSQQIAEHFCDQVFGATPDSHESEMKFGY